MTFATIAINDDPWQFELLPPRCSHCSDLDDYRLVYFCSSGKVLREGAAWGPGGAPAIHRQHRQTTGLARAHRHRRWREPQTRTGPDHHADTRPGPPGPSARSRPAPGATFLRNHDCDPAQPAHSAITMAGILGNATQQLPHVRLEGSNADGPFTCEYRDGELDATALETVSLDNPSRAAIARIDKPSVPRRYLICATPAM